MDKNKLKSYEMWWSNNLGKEYYIHKEKKYKAPSLEGFVTWMGDPNAPDRLLVRQFLCNFKTFLDVGCGACPEFYGLKQKFENFEYTGIDITPN